MSPPKPSPLHPQPTLERYYTNERERRGVIRELFEGAAEGYDPAEMLTSFGSGRWYRRKALERAGLREGMRVLDVATGTGLVAREAIWIVGDRKLVVGLDATRGMLALAREQLDLAIIEALAEQVPLGDEKFDFLSMGYALRHVSDLVAMFREYHRVLRPGGRALILEITKPASAFGRAFMKSYLRGVVPSLSKLSRKGRKAGKLWEYYWETIEACVDPDTILQAMRDGGFSEVERHVELGIFSEYRGIRR